MISDDLPVHRLISYIVAENGALVYQPKTRETTFSEPLLTDFSKQYDANITPVEIGSVIVATHVPNQEKILGIIQELGLELKITFNRGAVMVLPTGINKATGIKYALRKLDMSPHEIVAVGDSENDHSLLQLAECPVAVANALDAIKEVAAFVTKSPAGEGVIELIDELIADDLKHVGGRLIHRHILLGTRLDRTVVRVPSYGPNILVAGPSETGKSTLTAGFVERLVEKSYQVCIVDPEGDYVSVQGLVTIGDQGRVPSIDGFLSTSRPRCERKCGSPGVPLLIALFYCTLPQSRQCACARRPRGSFLMKPTICFPRVGTRRLSLPRGWRTLLLPSILITSRRSRRGRRPLRRGGAISSDTLREFATSLGKLPFSLCRIS